MVMAPQHFILFKCTESVIKWLSTAYTYNVLFCEQLNHIPIIFQYYWYNTTQDINQVYMYTPCVTALILSECTNSSFEAAQTALSQTAPNIVNLDLLLLTKCTDSSFLRGDEQSKFYCTNSSEQNSSKHRYCFISSRRRGWASHQIMLQVTGAAYIIRLIRDFFNLLHNWQRSVVVENVTSWSG